MKYVRSMLGNFIRTLWAVGRHLRLGIVLLVAPVVFAAGPTTTQTISLFSGWNLISIQIGDGPLSVGNFRAALGDPARLVEIWGYEPSSDPSVPGTWRTYQPQLAAFPNDLAELQPGRGYWVQTSQATTATLTGPAWTGSMSLSAGWNLVGFGVLKLGTNESQDLASVFGSTFDRVTQVWTFDSSSQRFAGYDLTAIPAVKTLSNINPGTG